MILCRHKTSLEMWIADFQITYDSAFETTYFHLGSVYQIPSSVRNLKSSISPGGLYFWPQGLEYLAHPGLLDDRPHST
jgi:hypothetical protein